MSTTERIVRSMLALVFLAMSGAALILTLSLLGSQVDVADPSNGGVVTCPPALAVVREGDDLWFGSGETGYQDRALANACQSASRSRMWGAAGAGLGTVLLFAGMVFAVRNIAAPGLVEPEPPTAEAVGS